MLRIERGVYPLLEESSGESTRMLEESSGESTRMLEESSGESTRMLVENSPDSHNPVENQRFTRSGRFEKWGSPRGPNRPAEAADGPLRAGQGGN